MSGQAHFIGIGGAGMAVVAELYLARGWHVSGSDARESAALNRLTGLGAQVHVGHRPEQVAGADVVVVSTAVQPDNVEVIAARAAGIEVVHRSVALARAAADLDMVAVAGAHGKTTTSAMLAVGLRTAGLDPSFAIGGKVLAYGTGAHLGSGPMFVAEADESDGSFLTYHPAIAVVTNVEPDHLDHHGSAERYQQAFVQFAATIRPAGLLVTCIDDPGAAALARSARDAGVRVCGYGTDAEAQVRIEIVELQADSSLARLHHDGHATAVQLKVPGEHNLRNATAAWCAGVELGVPAQDMAQALAAFAGTARRFEERGVAAGVRVVDDYAHNPTKVAAAVATARRATSGRVLVLFQPHLYSRTEQFAEQFARALAGADEVVLAPIYGAREAPRPDVTSGLIGDRLANARYLPDRLQAAAAIASSARAGDLVVTMGAGDVTELAEVILRELRSRVQEP
ncbi:MAG: UDP-N-acetylmuramate--L-alanine ligase [Beutenbergiaceae bacterium]